MAEGLGVTDAHPLHTVEGRFPVVMPIRLHSLVALLSAAACVAPLTACGGSEGGGDVPDGTTEGVSGVDGAPAEPVNARALRDLLPASLDGMERTAIEGATQSAMGTSISEATATYEGEEGTIDLTITDLGAMPSFEMMGIAWATQDMDRETSTGYERTVPFAGHRGYRAYDTEAQEGEFTLIVDDRFLIEVEGDGVRDDQLEAALQSLDLQALTALRDEGRMDVP